MIKHPTINIRICDYSMIHVTMFGRWFIRFVAAYCRHLEQGVIDPWIAVPAIVIDNRFGWIDYEYAKWYWWKHVVVGR